MPAGDEADEHPLDHVVLADDDALDLEEGALEGGAVLGGARDGDGAGRGRSRLLVSGAVVAGRDGNTIGNGDEK